LSALNVYFAKSVQQKTGVFVMKIMNRNNRAHMVTVDLLKPSKLSADGWLKPIDFEISQPQTLFVRMPHGPFALRVVSCSDAILEVLMFVDGMGTLQARIGRGVHIFERDSQGRAFRFAESEAHRGLMLQADPGSDSDTIKTQGQVAVQIRSFDTEKGAQVADQPSVSAICEQSVFFQMNPPDIHEEVCASLLSQIKALPAMTGADDLFRDFEGAAEIPRRFCCSCPRI
jgi:hypothetical protein